MKPLNARKRNRALLKVVGFFLVAFIVALLLSFMTMKTPQLSDKRCQKELLEVRENLKFQRDVITPNVNVTRGLLNKIPNHSQLGENLEVLNSDIAMIISDLNSEIQKLHTPDTVLYKDVIQVLSNLQIAYNRQLDLGETASDAIELTTELQLCKAENKQLEDQVRSLQANASKGTDCSQYIEQLTKSDKRVSQLELENQVLKKEIDKLRNQ